MCQHNYSLVCKSQHQQVIWSLPPVVFPPSDLTAKSQLGCTEDPCISKREANVWPRVNTLAVATSPEPLILHTLGARATSLCLCSQLPLCRWIYFFSLPVSLSNSPPSPVYLVPSPHYSSCLQPVVKTPTPAHNPAARWLSLWCSASILFTVCPLPFDSPPCLASLFIIHPCSFRLSGRPSSCLSPSLPTLSLSLLIFLFTHLPPVSTPAFYFRIICMYVLLLSHLYSFTVNAAICLL